jgi:glycosyltransferase involved in cell wall biosynthesis
VRIALVSSIVPFVQGGARNIVDWLALALEARGHETEVIYLPFDESPDRILAQMATYRMIDLTDQADLVVCFRPPSYLIRHPRKVLWFIHHVRPYYDLWDTQYRGFADTEIARARKKTIVRADTRALNEASAVFTNSRVVSARLLTYNDVKSEVLYPPLHQSDDFVNEGYGDEIVVIARLEHHKRQHLLVEALALCKSAVRLRFLGKGSSPDYGQHLRNRAAVLGVGDRVNVDDEWVEEGTKREILASALACAYLPLDEDSYGYPTLEAAYSHKGILTTLDSGGVLEFVEDGKSGLVVDSSPESIAAAMDRLYSEVGLAKSLGDGAHRRLEDLDISWAHVVDRITA